MQTTHTQLQVDVCMYYNSVVHVSHACLPVSVCVHMKRLSLITMCVCVCVCVVEVTMVTVAFCG